MAEKDKIVNRSLSCRHQFKPLEESDAKIRPGQVYGIISTPSFITCHSHEAVDYRLVLITNASIEHKLPLGFIYDLSGKLLLLNTPAPPMLNYFQDMATRVCSDANHMDDEGRKVFTSGIGLVQSVLTPNQSLEEDLQVSKKPDLRLVERKVKSFDVKYIVPSTPKLVNTHTMFRGGREFFFDGFLAGWDLANHMAIIQTSTLKGQTVTPKSSPVNKGRKFITFEEKGTLPVGEQQEQDHGSNSIQSGTIVDQGQGTSSGLTQGSVVESEEEVPLALSVDIKGKGKMVESVASAKKKRKGGGEM
ncbi:hypothetical protein PGTUg99_017026 [Puccinia graminis f. sp. tritici]|uniref:Uncharacterized protein n=1 Tax=Puccinia graminis f. sp. tritici TaxID=56615 RepID=A0A5B0MS76_PUCGR|nr:hypothetical protein PGTUg99_017026 [Puccinia graminis f. sp. tritici]